MRYIATGSWLRRVRPLRGLALAAVTLGALAPAAEATWSIILVDTATGEVAIGCATCLESLDLTIYCPVLLAGVGGACAQSSIDGNGRNRKLIWDEMQIGTSPSKILSLLRNSDGSHQSRQYGIVDLRGRQATFTGSQCGAFANGIAGSVGTLHYAIQGNVITGQPVIDDAEDAVINTVGDLAEKLMAGMEAAHAVGGDGRCSCDPSDADRCGSPPPGFDPNSDKSAHIGFMLLTRIGDDDGSCNASVGCANGSYYMDLNVAFQKKSDPDPVVQLRTLFDGWRDDWRGRPDHLRTTQLLSRTSRPGNGTTPATLTLTAIDWEGQPVGHGGATIAVTHAADSAGLTTVGAITDHGDGTYTVDLEGGVGQGLDKFVTTIDDGLGAVTLHPNAELNHTVTLKISATSISASAGGTIDLDLVGPDETPPADYLLLCSMSGTDPGLPVGEIVLPLNWDDLVLHSYCYRNGVNFINTDATLDDEGKAKAQFHVEADDLTPIVGLDLAFAYLTNGPVSFVSNFKLLTVAP